MRTENSVTSVAAKGVALAPFDQTVFNLKTWANHETSSSAVRSLLKPRVTFLQEKLQEACAKFDIKILEGSKVVNTFVIKHSPFNRNSQKYQEEYYGEYTFSFTLPSLEKVNELYDALSGLDFVSVSSPQFVLKNKKKLEKKALKDAFNKVQKRFAEECEILGLDVNQFIIDAWEASYSDTGRSQNVYTSSADATEGTVGCAAGGSAHNDMIDIASGMAEVTVNLEIAYRRK
jgi:uncharacterized protein YggE